jgi:hypothetical protein
MISTDKTKICATCEIEKPLDEFDEYITRTLQVKNRKNRCKNCCKIIIQQKHIKRRDRKRLENTRKCVGFCGQVKLLTEFNTKHAVCKNCTMGGYVSQWTSDIKQRSIKRGWDFDVDVNFIRELFAKQEGKCALTKIPFNFNHVKNKKYERDPFCMSLDRVNPNKGYTKDNVRLVCMIVNLALNNFGDNAFAKMCEEFVSNKKIY